MASADAPLTLADLDQIPVSRLREVKEKKDKALASAEIRTASKLLAKSWALPGSTS